MGGGPSKTTIATSAVQSVAENMNSVCAQMNSNNQYVTCDFNAESGCSGAVVDCMNSATVAVTCTSSLSAQSIQKAAATSSAVAHSNFLSGASTVNISNANVQTLTQALNQICTQSNFNFQNSYNKITCDAAKMKFYLGNKYSGVAACTLAAVSSAVQASSFKGSGASGDSPGDILGIVFGVIIAIIVLLVVVYIWRNLPKFNINVKSNYVYDQGVLISKNGQPVGGNTGQGTAGQGTAGQGNLGQSATGQAGQAGQGTAGNPAK